jgi:hypothetical protein
MEWTVQLQNAIVKVDKCKDVNWDSINFGNEPVILERYGIIMTEMPDTVFRWPTELIRQEKARQKAENEMDSEGWSTVVRKTRVRKSSVKYSINLIRVPGLFI